MSAPKKRNNKECLPPYVLPQNFMQKSIFGKRKKKVPKTTLASSPFPAGQPANREIYEENSFFLALPFKSHQKKHSLPKSRPHLATDQKTSYPPQHFLPYQAGLVLTNLSILLSSPSLRPLRPDCSIVPPQQGWRPRRLQHPRLLPRRARRRAERLRRPFAPSDIQPSSIRIGLARRRARIVWFEIRRSPLVRWLQWLPSATSVVRGIVVRQRGGGVAPYWGRGGRAAGDVRGGEGGVGTG